MNNNMNGMPNTTPSVSSSNMMMGLPSMPQTNTLPPSTIPNSMSLPSDQRKASFKTLFVCGLRSRT